MDNYTVNKHNVEKFQAVDAYWTPQVNIYYLLCTCGEIFQHRADRWLARCPVCGKSGYVEGKEKP
jgi:hypothetical protein